MRVRPPLAAAAVGLLLPASACTEAEPPGSGAADAVPLSDLPSLPVPRQHVEGAELFRRHCEECHGPAATGTEVGPPLAHPYYRPAHHSDAAFLLAVQRGVRAHHWDFGDMPAQPQVERAEAEGITAYVRWLQQEVGIR